MPYSHELETELTYLPRSLPKGLFKTIPRTVTDVYLYQDNLNSKIRLRSEEWADKKTFWLTKKITPDPEDASHQIEFNTPLTREEHNLFSSLPGKVVTKDRHELSIEGTPAEVDVFRGDLDGLVLLEFEFPAAADRDAFEPPVICGADVTQEDFIAGAALAGKSYADIAGSLAMLGYKRMSYE